MFTKTVIRVYCYKDTHIRFLRRYKEDKLYKNPSKASLKRLGECVTKLVENRKATITIFPPRWEIEVL